MAPVAKVGGLADVVAGLPRALRALGHDARVMLPFYEGLGMPSLETRQLGPQFMVASDQGPEACQVYSAQLGGVPLYLLEQRRLLSRDQIYGYADDLDRFV